MMLEKVLAMWVPITALLSPLTKCSHLLFLASLIEDSDLWGSLVTSPICGRQCRFRICELLRPCKIPTNSSWLASACSSEEAAFPGPEGMEMGHGVMIWVHSACLCVCVCPCVAQDSSSEAIHSPTKCQKGEGMPTLAICEDLGRHDEHTLGMIYRCL